ncbi:conserved hypothetical protein [Gammaproteobacteria bacterium]
MRKKIIEYTSPIDALVNVAKRLQIQETKHGMSSERFFDKYSKGLLSDDIVNIEWSNDYLHYLALRQEVEERLRHAA